jgi:AraC-like DNA-binding protein
VSYISRRPPASLQGIVERLWLIDEPDPANVAGAICPDGCAEIVLHLAAPMREQPRHLLVGQMDAPVVVTPTGRVTMVGARFTPSGLYRILPTAQIRLAQQVLPLDAVWHDWTRRAVDQVAGALDADQRLQAFGRALEALAGERLLPPDRGVDAALAAMRSRGGPIALEPLARGAGISRRQLERRFGDRVGVSPNLYGRIIRFQRAFAALGLESGAALAARLGFVDQAHMIHEVRRFSGQTPTLLADADGVTTFFANRMPS